jgi:hypothetical protein
MHFTSTAHPPFAECSMFLCFKAFPSPPPPQQDMTSCLEMLCKMDHRLCHGSIPGANDYFVQNDTKRGGDSVRWKRENWIRSIVAYFKTLTWINLKGLRKTQTSWQMVPWPRLKPRTSRIHVQSVTVWVNFLSCMVTAINTLYCVIRIGN